MKIATWNMGYGSPTSPSRKDKDAIYKAIKHLMSPEAGVDVLLMQEVYAPGTENNRNVFTEVPKNKPKSWGGTKGKDTSENKWGTAVFSADKPLEEVRLNINTSYPGTITIAKRDNIAFISMYGKAINYQKDMQEYYVQNLHRCLSDLSSLFLYPKLQKEHGITDFVIAGDWNIGPQFDREENKSASNFFERLAGFGFKDCLGNYPGGDYAETLRGSPKQIDWMFATDGLMKAKKNAYVDRKAEGYSDHFPIIAEFDV